MVMADFALGMLLGGVGGLFGIGGGLMAIPALGWLFDMPQALAQGTALVMVTPNVMLGFWRYKQRNPIDMSAACTLGLAAMGSTWLAAHWATVLDPSLLRQAFAGFLVVLALLLGWQAARMGRADREAPPRRIVPAEATAVIALEPLNPPPLRKGPLALLGLVSGVFSGLFTVGGGVVATPVFTGLMGVRKQTLAQGLSLALVVPGSVIALGTYAHAGQVDWATGLPMAAGGLLSISWGVALAHSLPERWLRYLFCGLLLSTAVLMR